MGDDHFDGLLGKRLVAGDERVAKTCHGEARLKHTRIPAGLLYKFRMMNNPTAAVDI